MFHFLSINLKPFNAFKFDKINWCTVIQYFSHFYVNIFLLKESSNSFLRILTTNHWAAKKLNLHRRPSVITWMQSFEFCVIGHLNNAPDRFVPGWRFWPSGAPTRSLQRKREQNKSVNLSRLKWKVAMK